MNASICEKCLKRPGEPHVFFYGKKISSTSTQISYNKQMISTSYKVGGNGGKVLCKTCIRNYKINTLTSQFLLGMATAAYAILVYSTTPIGEITGFQCVLVSSAFLSILGSIAFFVGFINSIKRGQSTWGENLAIKLEKKELQNKGFDTFWNSEEYLELQKKI